jgi:hypothetical protein
MPLRDRLRSELHRTTRVVIGLGNKAGHVNERACGIESGNQAALADCGKRFSSVIRLHSRTS